MGAGMRLISNTLISYVMMVKHVFRLANIRYLAIL